MTTRLRIEAYPQDEVPPLLQVQAEALLNRIWQPPEGLSSWAPHDPSADPVSLFLLEESLVVASLEVLALPLSFDGTTFLACGLSRVRVLPERRGEGLGLLIVRAAYDVIEESGADLAIFTCDTPLTGFYEQAGFAVLEGTVLEGGSPGHPYPSDQDGFDKAVVAAFLTDHGRAHRDAFRHARVPLHPGEIDLLW